MGCRTNSGRRHSCRLGRPRGWRGPPRPAANAVRSRWSRSPGQRCRPPVARPAGGIAQPSRGEPLAPVPHPCSSCFIRSRSGTANSAAIVAASPGVITPPASAEVTAFIAAAMSWAFSPRALSRGSTLDRRQDKLHRAFAAWRQDAFEAEPHRAHGSRPWTESPRSPTSANSTALRVNASASPFEQRRGGDCRLVAAADPAA